MIVKELFALLGFEFQDKNLKKFDAAVGQARGRVGQLLSAVGLADISVGALALSFAHAAEETLKMSERTGVASDDLQALAFAADMSDVSTQDLGMSLTFLNRALFASREGSQQATEAFSNLGGGILAAVKRGASAGELLPMIADRMAAIEDPAKRTALAMQIFGRSGTNLIPFLVKGGEDMHRLMTEARELGLVMDKEVLESGEEFADQLKLTKNLALGLKNVIGSQLVNVMLDGVKAFNKWYVANGRVIAQGLTEVFLMLYKAARLITVALGNIASLMSRLTAPFGGLLRVVQGLVAAFFAWKALQFVFALGSMAKAAFDLAKGFQFVGNAAAIAQVKALALPLLIGAAIIGLLLLLEDIAVYLEGGDSFIGVLFNKVPEVLSFLKTTFGSVFDPMLALFNGIKDGTLSWLDALKLVGATLVNLILMPIRMIFSLFGNLFAAVGRLQGMGLLQNIGADLQGVADFFKMSTPTTQPSVSGGTSSSTSNQITQNIENNFGAVTDPSAVASSVGDASGSALDEILRNASRSFTPGVAY